METDFNATLEINEKRENHLLLEDRREDLLRWNEGTRNASRKIATQRRGRNGVFFDFDRSKQSAAINCSLEVVSGRTALNSRYVDVPFSREDTLHARGIRSVASSPFSKAPRARKSVLAGEKNAKYRGEFAGVLFTGAAGGKMPRINRGRQETWGSPARYGWYTIYFHIRAQRGHMQLPWSELPQMRSTARTVAFFLRHFFPFSSSRIAVFHRGSLEVGFNSWFWFAIRLFWSNCFLIERFSDRTLDAKLVFLFLIFFYICEIFLIFLHLRSISYILTFVKYFLHFFVSWNIFYIFKFVKYLLHFFVSWNIFYIFTFVKYFL